MPHGNVQHSSAPAAGLAWPPAPAAGAAAREARTHTADTANTADTDTRTAVEDVLEAALLPRLAEAKALDDAFGVELAERVVRFALHGGKRLRSSFTWWGWRAAGGAAHGEQARGTLRVAAALELIQACALIHDDVMDGSPLRRGRPAVHVDLAAQHERRQLRGGSGAFGRSGAVLAGDLALAWADDMAFDAATETGTWPRIRDVWRSMRTEMVAGQYLDLRGQAAATASPETALRIACLKSALYTVERPLGLGTRMAGAGTRTERALRAAARNAGLAFQLRDDLRGVFGDPRRTGKPSGDDLRQGKITYLLATARLSAAKSGARAATQVLERCAGDADLSDAQLRLLRQAVVDTGAVEAVETKIGQLVAESLRELAAAPIDPAAARELSALVRTAAGTPDDQTAGSAEAAAGGDAAR